MWWWWWIGIAGLLLLTAGGILEARYLARHRDREQGQDPTP